MIEIPAGKECDGTFGSGRELQYWTCPFYQDIDGGGIWCAAFEKDMYGGRVPACLSAYPNGAVITITAKEVK